MKDWKNEVNSKNVLPKRNPQGAAVSLILGDDRVLRGFEYLCDCRRHEL